MSNQGHVLRIGVYLKIDHRLSLPYFHTPQAHTHSSPRPHFLEGGRGCWMVVRGSVTKLCLKPISGVSQARGQPDLKVGHGLASRGRLE